MRRPARVFLITVLAGVVAFVLLGALRQSEDAFTLNVPITAAIGALEPEATFCQDGIVVPEGGAFHGGRLTVGTERRPGPELRVRLTDADDRTIARATIAGGYADNSSPRFRFDRTIDDGRGLRLCVTNVGDVPAFPYGSGGDPNPSTAFTIDDVPLAVDVAVVFERPARSTLAAAGDILERATLFRTPRLSAVVYGIVLVLLLAGATAAGAVALRAAEREDDTEAVERDEP